MRRNAIARQSKVAYGLPVTAAPSLKDNETLHVEAVDYHKQLAWLGCHCVDACSLRNKDDGAAEHGNH